MAMEKRFCGWKRLGCAARGVVVQLHLVVDKNYQPRDISLEHLPVVTYQGQRVFEGLLVDPDKTIQAWLEKGGLSDWNSSRAILLNLISLR